VSSFICRMVRSLTPRQVTWEKFSPTHENNVNSALTAYGLSKFANVLFAAELNRRLSPEGVTAFSLHPGVVDTAISRNTSLIRTFMCCCGCTTDSVVSQLGFALLSTANQC
jgi:NAD(P)-dependent dehydrogenase (short-subunit alcohol dehydrogenase family)